MNDPRGSIWRKWDLHIHSPSSVLNNQYPGTNEDEKWNGFIQTVKSLKDISVLGITDYFSIDGYNKLLEYRDKNPQDFKNIELLLPNVELRILPVTAERTPINLHVIFSPDKEIIDNLESQFFSNLTFSYGGSTYRCIRQDLINLGKAHSHNNGMDEYSAYKAGVEQFKTSLDQLKQAFKDNEKLRLNSLIIVSNSEADGASGIQHSSLAATRQEIYRFADAIFSANPSDRSYFLGKGSDSSEQIIKKYGSLKPCIHGSDAHELEKICKPDFDRFTWIKADTTFEGLKQIIYEPESRVKIRQDNPEESETYAKINKLSTTLPDKLEIYDKESRDRTDFCIRGKTYLFFSNNLTCLIGGRGSGKSTLGHLLFNRIGKNKERLEAINSPLLSLDLKPAPLKYLFDNSKCDGPEQTEFFFQNEIEKAAKNLEQMSQMITSRLERLSSVDGENLEDLRKTCVILKMDITRLLDAYDNIISIKNEMITKVNNIDVLEKQTEVIQSEEYKGYQKAIKQLTDAISGFNTYKTGYEELLAKLNDLTEYIDKLKWNNEQGQDVAIGLKTVLNNNKEAIKSKFLIYEKAYQEKKLGEQLSSKKLELSAFLKTKGLSQENIQELTNANQIIAELKNEIGILMRKQEPYQKIYDNRVNCIQAYKSSYEKYKTRYEDVSKLLQSKLTALSLSNKNKDITFEIERDDESLINVIVALIKDNLKEENTNAGVIRKILFNEIKIEDYIENKQKIKERVEAESGAEKHAQLLKELVNEDSFLEQMYLRLIKEYYDINNIRAQTKLGGKILRNTSFGERCAIVISIIIAAGTNPILIDQPEDNLDSRFVTSSLVPLIRSQKHNRQIILITRDANIVIGGDAELINILDEKGNITDIIPSTIENTGNREKYIWILDGGEEAFKKREQKYSIKKA